MNLVSTAAIGAVTAGVVVAHEPFLRHFDAAKRARATNLTAFQVSAVGIGVGLVAAGLNRGRGASAALQAAAGGAAMVAGAQAGRMIADRIRSNGPAADPVVPPAAELGGKTPFVPSRAMEMAIAGAPLGAVLLHNRMGWKLGAVVGAVTAAAMAPLLFSGDWGKVTNDV